MVIDNKTKMFLFISFITFKNDLLSDDYSQFVDVCKINKALWILFLSYVVFTAPLVAIGNSIFFCPILIVFTRHFIYLQNITELK